MLRLIGTDIWVVDYDHFVGLIHFPTRMTVLRRTDGGIVIVSAVPLTDMLQQEIEELGPVKVLLAPNMFHHMYLAPAVARFPQAAVYGPQGLEKKRKEVPFTELMGPDISESLLGPGITIVPMKGVPAIGEFVLFHEASGTLVTTDLVMNVHAVRGFLSRLIYFLEGGWKRAGVPRLYRLLMKNRDAWRASFDRILGFPVRQLLMAHGTILESDPMQPIRAERARLGP
jgi:hypothetical protein